MHTASITAAVSLYYQYAVIRSTQMTYKRTRGLLPERAPADGILRDPILSRAATSSHEREAIFAAWALGPWSCGSLMDPSVSGCRIGTNVLRRHFDCAAFLYHASWYGESRVQRYTPSNTESAFDCVSQTLLSWPWLR